MNIHKQPPEHLPNRLCVPNPRLRGATTCNRPIPPPARIAHQRQARRGPNAGRMEGHGGVCSHEGFREGVCDQSGVRRIWWGESKEVVGRELEWGIASCRASESAEF